MATTKEMKPPQAAWIVIASICLFTAVPLADAGTYYWDSNSSTAGFGTADGTWTNPTVSRWSTSTTGVVVPGDVTTTTADVLNFGNGATGLASGTITVSGTVDSGNMTFASGSGAITLSGGTINLAATSTITADNATHTINSLLTGAGTSLTKAGSGNLILGGNNTGRSGVTLINGGILTADHNNALGSGAVTIGTGAIRLQLSTGIIIANDITIGSGTTGQAGYGLLHYNGNGNATLSGGTITIQALAGAGGHFGSTGGGTLTVASAVNSASSTVVFRAGTGIFSGGGSYSSLALNEGTVRLGANNGLSSSATLIMSGVANSTFDLSGYDQSLSGLLFTVSDAARNLTITGGSNSTLTINATASTELGTGGAISGARNVTTDMSGLGELVWNGSAYTFRVGVRSGSSQSGTSSNSNPGTFTTTLADNNTITATRLAVGDQGVSRGGGTSIMYLGQTNELNADTIAIGLSRANGTVEFRSGLTGTPTVTVRGTAGGSQRVSTWSVGSVATFSTAPLQSWTAVNDFSAGQLDALVTDMTLGAASIGTSTDRSGVIDARFIMGKGTLDVTNLTIGRYAASSGATVGAALTGSGTFTLNHSTGTVIAENIILADNVGVATGSTRSVSGTFNLTAGTLEAKSIGKGADTGNATSVMRAFNFTSGTIRNYTGSNLTIADVPITLTGSGTRYFDATSGQSISVSSAISGSGQGFTKSGAGALTLSATNGYSGATDVSAGTLYVTGALSSSAVTVENGAAIGSNGMDGTLGNGLTINTGGKLDLTGATLGATSSGILTLSGGSLSLGNFSFQNLVGWDWANADAGTYQLIDGAFAINWGSTAYLDAGSAYNFGNGKMGYFESGSLNAVIFAIPEPGAALLGGFGVLLLALRRKR